MVVRLAGPVSFPKRGHRGTLHLFQQPGNVARGYLQPLHFDEDSIVVMG
jgi:hypothetical protein